MKAVIQRVKSADVCVDGKVVGKIDNGYMILLGVVEGDTIECAELLASKVSKLRVFEDDNGKMNLSVLDVGGEVLVVSQFTLCADCKKGNRPSFTSSAHPEIANDLYLKFSQLLRDNGISKVENGIFGADMQVSLTNDGPVTIIFDTDTWRKS